TLAPAAPIVPTGMALLVAVTALNVVGVGKLSKVQIVVATISVVGLVALMIGGFSSYRAAHFDPLFPKGASGFLSAAAFVFVSYAGVTKIAALAGEVKNPDKNLPRGITITLLVAATLYGVVNFALAAVVPMDRLVGNLRPIYALADVVGGRKLGIAAAVLSIVTMTSMAAAGLLASSRFPYAMARDKLLPALLGGVSVRTRSPVPAISATAVFMGLSIATLDVMKIAKLASAFTILMYMAECLAVIVLREGRVSWYRPTYRAPLYPVLPIAGVISGLGLVILLGLLPSVGALVLSLLGAMIFFGYSRSRTAERGVVSKIGRRDDLLSSARSERPPSQPVVSSAQVVVALFGNERSPEMLVDVGAALSDEGRTHVMHFTEVDDATEAEALLEQDDAFTASLERRIGAMAEETGMPIAFDAVATRDIVRSVHAVTDQAHCDWIVMQWQGRPRRSLTSLTPVGWLINHLPANLAIFKDSGVRYVRKILALPAPGPHDALVVRTADHLAMRYRAAITLARFVSEDAPEEEVDTERDYLAQLDRLCEADAEQELIVGAAKVPAIASATAGFDLLVMAGPQVNWRNLLLTSVEDRITEQAACSVLRLRTPRGGIHAAYSKRAEHSPAARRIRLVDYVGEGDAVARVDARQKSAMMSYLARHFAERLDGQTLRAIEDAFLEREKEQNTGVGNGVALPHGTMEVGPRAVVGIFTLREPIDYGAIDDEPVDVLFATLCPSSEREAHLQLLSDIARLASLTDVLERLRAAEDGEAMIRAITECSEQLAEA
ncbi:MAG TPA: amino acid permease, partial [Polyangiaceae bacterium]|nr:amino acid permease [Polyangiaceae bacterium]